MDCRARPNIGIWCADCDASFIHTAGTMPLQASVSSMAQREIQFKPHTRLCRCLLLMIAATAPVFG